MTQNQTITAIKGLRVGHVTNEEGATGCTVVLCPDETVASVDVRGGAPGTRETDLLQPQNSVQTVNAIVLSGGSAFGLATADGVMRYLRENDMGYKTQMGYTVPIVAGAILFDLLLGEPAIYPDAEAGYRACQNATTEPVEQGSVGAGTGAVCGAMLGKEFATKGGIGSSAIYLPGGIVVGALVAVNPVGDVLDEHNNILAGVRQPPDGDSFMGMLNALEDRASQTKPPDLDARQNTVIGVVASNAMLTKTETYKVAQMSHDGIARTIKPAHTPFDGDTVFALSTGEVSAEVTLIGAFATQALERAIRNAVRHATSIDGVRPYNA